MVFTGGASYLFTMFNPVVSYRYLFPTMYLFMAYNANPDLCVCVVVGPGFVSASPDFMRSSATHPACIGRDCWPREQFTHTIAVLTESSNI